jgi:L-fuconolactonase
MAVLRRDFLVKELAEVAAESRVDGFVAVQARQSIAETSALVDIAAQSPLVLGVVGWVPLADEDCGKKLAALSQSPWLKAIRHVVQDEPDDRFLLGEAFNRGVAMLAEFGLAYDVLIYGRQLPAAIEFADRHPNLPMVVDHIAKPTIDPKRYDDSWEAGFRELARREHVMCKFSGVVTEIVRSDDAAADQWSIDQIRRYWDVALEAFTPARLMFGSDWPVCLLRTSHIRWLETVRQLAAGLSDSERDALFSGNATRFYRLEPV